MTTDIFLLLGCLALASYFGWSAKRSVVTGIAPGQALVIAMGKQAVTRSTNSLAFWFITLPTMLGALFTAACGIAIVLANFGAFRPYGGN